MSGRQITVGGGLALPGYCELVSPFATQGSCGSPREAIFTSCKTTRACRLQCAPTIGRFRLARRSSPRRAMDADLHRLSHTTQSFRPRSGLLDRCVKPLAERARHHR